MKTKKKSKLQEEKKRYKKGKEKLHKEQNTNSNKEKAENYTKRRETVLDVLCSLDQKIELNFHLIYEM